MADALMWNEGQAAAVAGCHDARHALLMSVDTYWRRADPDAVQGLDPPALRKLVPFSFDDRFRQEADIRITVLAEDTGGLICRLLRLGAGDDSDDYAAWLAVEGADGVDGDDMIGVLTPEQVATVAEFLSRVQPAAWMQQFQPEIAAYARKIGYQTPFDNRWAQAVVADMQELTELFRLAAAADEAVIVMVYA